MELKRMAMCIKSSLSSIIPKNLQAGYNMANPQLLLSELAGRYKETGPVSSSVLGKQLIFKQHSTMIYIAETINPFPMEVFMFRD
ncbi:hypothetical protein YC2023_114998 [Brassica napus]